MEKSTAVIIDDNIANDIFTCFRALKEFNVDVYLRVGALLECTNSKLKKFIINKGIFEFNMITIHDENRKIIFTHHADVFELHEYLTSLNIYEEVKIITSSLNLHLTSKMRKMSCELYHVNIDDLSDVLKNKSNRLPIINQCKFESEKLYRYKNNQWSNINLQQIYGITPININQNVYLDLLTDDAISLVMCVGQAGTGKTFLACLAGIFKTYDENKYENILITRATVNIGDNSIGFLPGTKEEKMEPWIQPIKDNLKIVFTKKNEFENKSKHNSKNKLNSKNSLTHDYENVIDIQDDFLYHRGLSKKNKKKQNKIIKRLSQSKMIEKNMFNDNKIKIECISFFRGRTLENTYCIIDECQNLTSHEIKTIITRIGKNSKLIMLGDDSQSDLKMKSNAYVNAIYSMCDNQNVGIIKLNDTVRSELAKLAVKML